MVTKYVPNQELDVVRNPNYWGGPVYLDGIHFTWPQGDKSKVQALQSGDLSVVHISDPAAIENGINQKQAGFTWLRYGGGSVMMNERSGHHASDVRVRQAIAYAVNPKALNDRVFGSKGLASSALFPSGILHTSTPPLSYDQTKARQLLDTVKKSTGWDGSIPILVSADPVQHDSALVIQAMLNAVGFHATVDTAPSINDFVGKVYVKYDYDLAVAALDVSESDPWAQLVVEFIGPYAPEGCDNPKMNAALDQLRAAATPAEMTAATSKIQTIWNESVPEVWFQVAQDTVMWSPKLHGVVPTSQSSVLLAKAWLGK
jgi:peptide/nickel transport system substrate-binding protein